MTSRPVSPRHPVTATGDPPPPPRQLYADSVHVADIVISTLLTPVARLLRFHIRDYGRKEFCCEIARDLFLRSRRAFPRDRLPCVSLSRLRLYAASAARWRSRHVPLLMCAPLTSASFDNVKLSICRSSDRVQGSLILTLRSFSRFSFLSRCCVFLSLCSSSELHRFFLFYVFRLSMPSFHVSHLFTGSAWKSVLLRVFRELC